MTLAEIGGILQCEVLAGEDALSTEVETVVARWVLPLLTIRGLGDGPCRCVAHWSSLGCQAPPWSEDG